jgi:GNAT superfamily N-acetyltransferase
MTFSAAYAVRSAEPSDLPLIGPIEESGDALFATVFGDLQGSALSSPAPSGGERAEKPGFLLVSGEPAVAFVHVLVLDGHAHLEQISVHPDHGRRGVGAALLEAACAQALAQGFAAITLMTYADLPWNGPFYAHHGFVEVEEGEPRLPYQRRLQEIEAKLDLARHGRRVLMRRSLVAQRTADELEAFLPEVDASPKDVGRLRLLVARPVVGERTVLDQGTLDLAVGLIGDNWNQRPSSRMPDNSPHPLMQLNVMNHRIAEFLAVDPSRAALAGDQLYLDLDLSHENLPAGTILEFGEADTHAGPAIEVTEEPHTGCAQFIARFGAPAMRFVNGPDGRPRRLRGLNARVLRPGVIRVSDVVRVLRQEG